MTVEPSPSDGRGFVGIAETNGLEPAANAEPAWRSWTLALPPEALFCFHC